MIHQTGDEAGMMRIAMMIMKMIAIHADEDLIVVIACLKTTMIAMMTIEMTVDDLL